MKKIYLLAFGLISIAGLAMVGLGLMLSLQMSSGPMEAKITSPAAPVEAAPLAAAELNTRDAMLSSGDELASIEMSDQTFASELAAAHRDDLMGDDAPLAMDAGIPPASPAPSAALSAPAAPSSWFRSHRFVWHRIRWGETLSGIAEHFDTSVWRLVSLNGIRCANRIIAGRWILVPADN